MSDLRAQFPEKLLFLFGQHRYKVAHGGRGSSKSWAFARALLLQAYSEPLRILCTREVQKSIKDSVHRLLSDQIELLGLSAEFDILETVIRCRNGSEFLFNGLSNMTAESVKSYEGIDRCWCEEAQTISKRSWDILIPTIRKPGSEIWVTFNPLLDTDDTWTRFVVNTPANAKVVQVNHNDNPWFPEVLREEMEHCRVTSPEDYQNIWEGKCRAAVEGAIYASEVADAQSQQRVCNVPYDPMLKVHAVWDLGWADSMAIILVQKGVSELRVIDYIEDSHKTLDHYISILREKRFNWGFDWIPHDGQAKDFKTGKSTEELLKAFGRKPKIIPNMGVEPGIKAARMVFGRTYFDKTKTVRLMECLKRYRRHVSNTTGEPGAPMHDAYSHGADAFRYLGVVADMLRNENDTPPPRVEVPAYDSVMGY